MTAKNLRNTILTIDDDGIFRDRLTKAFAKRGLIAEQAENSTEALKKIKELNPDLIVLDLKLGNESGLDLITEILVLCPKTKIVMLTGYGTIGTTVEAMKKGVVNYLTKPVDADTILAAFLGEIKVNSTTGIPPLHQIEWDYIQKIIEQCEGNITKASKLLGLHRRSLQRKMKKSPGSLK